MRQTRGVELANEDIFISIDDDNIYASNMVSTLAHYSLKYPDCALAASSQLLLFWNIPNVAFPPLRVTQNSSSIGFLTDIIEGCGSIAYRGKHFDLELFHSVIFSQSDLYTACYLSDDMLLSYMLAFGQVQLVGLYWEPIDLHTFNIFFRAELPFFNDKYAIHAQDFDGSHGSAKNMNSNKYNVCYRYLISSFIDFKTRAARFRSRDEMIALFSNETRF